MHEKPDAEGTGPIAERSLVDAILKRREEVHAALEFA